MNTATKPLPDYRVFLSRSGRHHNPVRHIGVAEASKRGACSKFGTALCPAKVQWYPESGDMGKIENATCRACQREYRKRTEARARAIMEAESADFTESGTGRDTLIASAWAPAGRNWKATGGHSLSVNFHSGRAAGWLALLADLEQGTEPCTADGCDTCQEAS